MVVSAEAFCERPEAGTRLGDAAVMLRMSRVERARRLTGGLRPDGHTDLAVLRELLCLQAWKDRANLIAAAIWDQAAVPMVRLSAAHMAQFDRSGPL
jgi:hypothetical protein